ncbi:hypothetical protein M433DRAFT_154321 [Acidomyces richmondensis BFW]|nr:MAG: hypothetical protein FE78DRAFT_90392 [Acidomyces sp. 'richmondensis']KYG45607.1 hypothetical protein M433DRAFT_154321 [Acidomyces richmondensis BFW]
MGSLSAHHEGVPYTMVFLASILSYLFVGVTSFLISGIRTWHGANLCYCYSVRAVPPPAEKNTACGTRNRTSAALHPLYPVPVIGESLDCVNCTTHRLLQYLGAGVEVIITLASSFVGQYI